MTRINFTSHNDEKWRYALTLAETLVVVSVLGIVAVLTIPSIYTKHKVSVNRVKVRKAMATYDATLRKMVTENRVRNLSAWASSSANCGKTTNYFMKMQGSGCTFRTRDGLWWNISDIEKPLISTKAINDDNIAVIKTSAADLSDYTAFFMVGRKDENGKLRIDDLAYETGNPLDYSDKYVTKLYNYINNSNLSYCEINNYICKYERGDYKQPCAGENINCSSCAGGTCEIYGRDGDRVIEQKGCNGQNEDCPLTIEFYPGGKRPSKIIGPIIDIGKIFYGNDDEVCGPLIKDGTYTLGTTNEDCKSAAQCNLRDKICNAFDENGVRIMKIQDCTGLSDGSKFSDLSTCKKIDVYYTEDGTVNGKKVIAGKTAHTNMTGCDHVTGVCASCKGPDCSKLGQN